MKNKVELIRAAELKAGDHILMQGKEYIFIRLKIENNCNKMIVKHIDSGLEFNGKVFSNDLIERIILPIDQKITYKTLIVSLLIALVATYCLIKIFSL